MVSDDGPWERIEEGDFLARWEEASCGMTLRQAHKLELKEHVELAAYTTFGISAKARWFVEVTHLEELRASLDWATLHQQEILVLGGGSNMLLHDDFDGLVIWVAMRGVEVLEDDGRHVTVAVGAGEVWHEFVLHALDNGWGGLENLSLIPGSVGASPMQNIGAYGVEIKDHLVWVDAVRRSDGALERFDNRRCEFGYRDSIFKRAEKDQWILTQVAFKLDRQSPLRMDYGSIEEELKQIPLADRTHKDVSDAVIRIRQSKLPDPTEIGNAGSFFKNPEVESSQARALLETHPSMPQYEQASGKVKLAAGWLIEQSGWKGHNRETHGVHDRQALVLVHFGGASGREIWKLAEDIMASVKEKFGVELVPEVNQVGKDSL